MEVCLAKKILTHGAFGNHITEVSPSLAALERRAMKLYRRCILPPSQVTFPHPVLLTTARVGAVPSSGGFQQPTQLLLFAQDAAAPAAARFMQLCPGFEQPPHGTRSVHLQPCVTTRILLRGEYQTVPLSLYGKSMEAAGPPPVAPQRLTLPSALQWLQQQEEQAKEQQQQQQPHANAVAWQDAPLQPPVAALLSRLITHWDVVGTSERLMALSPPPTSLFKDVAACADAICAQLVNGSFGDKPPALDPQPALQQQAMSEPARAEHAVTADRQQAEAAVGDGVANAEHLLDAASDMVLGWCCMLGAGAAGRTKAAVRCSTAGLAAAVLLCSCGAGARRMASRWGVVPLDDVLTMPRVRLLPLCFMLILLDNCSRAVNHTHSPSPSPCSALQCLASVSRHLPPSPATRSPPACSLRGVAAPRVRHLCLACGGQRTASFGSHLLGSSRRHRRQRQVLQRLVMSSILWQQMSWGSHCVRRPGPAVGRAALVAASSIH